MNAAKVLPENLVRGGGASGPPKGNEGCGQVSLGTRNVLLVVVVVGLEIKVIVLVDTYVINYPLFAPSLPSPFFPTMVSRVTL